MNDGKRIPMALGREKVLQSRTVVGCGKIMTYCVQIWNKRDKMKQVERLPGLQHTHMLKLQSRDQPMLSLLVLLNEQNTYLTEQGFYSTKSG